MHVDCTEHPRNQGGRPSRTFTFTAEELGSLLGISPSAVLKRDERGQNLLAQRRYGVIKDVTEEPKKKAAVAVDPVAVRARDVAEIEAGSKVPGNAQTLTSMLLAAWDMGHNCGARR